MDQQPEHPTQHHGYHDKDPEDIREHADHASDFDEGGVAFREFWDSVVIPQAKPATGVSHLVFTSFDGYQSVVAIEDALNDDVLLADRLNDEDLPPEHGAPLRLVSPSQYGYKSTKHLCGIRLHTAAPKSKLGRKEHLRAHVSLEERHSALPPWLVRWPYRLAVPILSYTCYLGTRRSPSLRSRTP